MSALSERMLAENYDSVVAAQNMKESLERQDSATLFMLLGEWERALPQMQEHRLRFDAAYRRAAGNITEPGEADVIRAIGAARDEYDRRVDRFVQDARGDRGRSGDPSTLATREYFDQLEPIFTELRGQCDRLLDSESRRDAAEGRRSGRALRAAGSWRRCCWRWRWSSVEAGSRLSCRTASFDRSGS